VDVLDAVGRPSHRVADYEPEPDAEACDLHFLHQRYPQLNQFLLHSQLAPLRIFLMTAVSVPCSNHYNTTAYACCKISINRLNISLVNSHGGVKFTSDVALLKVTSCLSWYNTSRTCVFGLAANSSSMNRLLSTSPRLAKCASWSNANHRNRQVK
jgi:hypothetical protein